MFPLKAIKDALKSFWPHRRDAAVKRGVVGLEERPHPQRPIVLVSPACPYCGEIQEPPPQRRRKCRDCGEVIYTRTNQHERKRYLITAEHLEQAELKERNSRWQDLSRQVQDAMMEGDWAALAQAYREQSEILFVEGRPHQHVRQEAVKAELRRLQQSTIKYVRVSTSRDERVCADCSALEGVTFSVSDALTQLPLPNLTCTDGDNPHGGRCRCIFLPEVG